MTGFFTLQVRPTVAAANVAALRTQPGTILTANMFAFVASPQTLYYWDPADVAADNGTTVIVPTGWRPTAGSWLASSIGGGGGGTPSGATPIAIVDSNGAAGASTDYSRGDHDHAFGQNLLAATGDESAVTLAYVANKSTSGDAYGLDVQVTETSVPDNSYWLSVSAGGVRKLRGFTDGVLTWSPTATLALIQEQRATAGAGSGATLRAQRGNGSNIGGTLTIGGGDGGTPGTDQAGSTDVQLGALVSNISAKMRFITVGTEQGYIQKTAFEMLFNSTSGLNLFAGGAVNLRSSSQIIFDVGSSTQVTWRGDSLNTSRIDLMPHNGAASETWAQGITSFTQTIAQKTGDNPAASTNIAGQPASAAGTGANLNGGEVNLVAGNPQGAGRHGHIGDTFGNTWSRRFSEEGQTTTAGALSLFEFALATGTPYHVKARITGRSGDNIATFERILSVNSIGGTATIAGTVTNVHAGASAALATATATIDVTGANVRVIVTGVAVTTIEWSCVVEIYKGLS